VAWLGLKEGRNTMIPNYIPAADIASQFWCEMQGDLGRKYGDIKKPEKEKGKEIHRDLHLEISRPIPVEAKTPAERLYSTLHNISVGINQYKRNRITREFTFFARFGSLFGSLIMQGVIDEIREVEEDGDKRVRVVETKTRVANRGPPPAQIYRDRIQGMIYGGL
jgi:hypothetical protein